MAREIIKGQNNTYEEIDNVLQFIDPTWNNIRTWDKFKFTKHPFKTYYISPITLSIDKIRGPYKVFDLLGNTLQVERSNKIFTASNSLINYGPIIVYLKTDKDLYMLFVSRNAITDEYKKEEIVVNTVNKTSISINNTTTNSIFYSYENQSVPPPSFIEVPAGVIEVFEPTSVGYLYIIVNNNPITINTTNTRTKLVNNNYLLICPTTTSGVQAAKLTGNPLSTITNELDLFITI